MNLLLNKKKNNSKLKASVKSIYLFIFFDFGFYSFFQNFLLIRSWLTDVTGKLKTIQETHQPSPGKLAFSKVIQILPQLSSETIKWIRSSGQLLESSSTIGSFCGLTMMDMYRLISYLNSYILP